MFGPELRFVFDRDNGSDLQKTVVCHTRVPDTPEGLENLYVRLRIPNVGRSAAEEVEVILKRVSRRMEGGYVPVNDFLPLNLTWTNISKPYYPLIPPGVDRHLDVFKLQEPGDLRRTLLSERRCPQLLMHPHNFDRVADVRSTEYVLRPAKPWPLPARACNGSEKCPSRACDCVRKGRVFMDSGTRSSRACHCGRRIARECLKTQLFVLIPKERSFKDGPLLKLPSVRSRNRVVRNDCVLSGTFPHLHPSSGQSSHRRSEAITKP